ncbi:uncharacterized protein EKO05_0000843 [Ascochyta rabiei]|uniref:Sequence-specific DNA binding n=1 Tax=Didymella rabiei TaxID=5454 RepID=A0A163CHC2_DIDRA|nr:uncharacterized protein EKO05_0000843 [Ascochyta rabiei]KZM22462.1 sequence-specific DNA binding [Ascochyta rabiei]UPX10172.1 hypothetical protein EKO05_0000843 [Ascochyta rabiei]
MSVAILATEALSDQYQPFEPDFNMHSTSDCWAPAPWGKDAPMTTTGYMDFVVANPRPSDRQSTFQSSFEQTNLTNRGLNSRIASKYSFKDLDTQSSINTTLAVSTAALCPSSADTIAYDSRTVSHTDTRFNSDHASPSSNCRFSLDNQLRHAGSPKYTMFTDDTNPLSSKRRCDSPQSNFVTHSSTTPQSQVGRRRGSEYVEPGSARAVYLEKNRKAASKCRSKQKRQEEDLVEAARDAERRNKLLKAEVEMLKNSMRDLMQLVGQHTQCPDTRLKLYLQRQADRLAIRGQRNNFFSSLSASLDSGMGSIDKVLSPEGE